MPPELIISCLSQKGGVGKSTLARLIARTYAAAGWVVAIADFSTKQLTSVCWAQSRAAANILLVLLAHEAANWRKAQRFDVDLLVCDGPPISDWSMLEVAKASNLIVIPAAGVD